MCHQITCERCAKPSWSGCGNHVEQALAGVALSDRYTCDQQAGSSSSASTEAIFSRFLGR
jgi:hypothetical protein